MASVRCWGCWVLCSTSEARHKAAGRGKVSTETEHLGGRGGDVNLSPLQSRSGQGGRPHVDLEGFRYARLALFVFAPADRHHQDRGLTFPHTICRPGPSRAVFSTEFPSRRTRSLLASSAVDVLPTRIALRPLRTVATHSSIALGWVPATLSRWDLVLHRAVLHRRYRARKDALG